MTDETGSETTREAERPDRETGPGKADPVASDLKPDAAAREAIERATAPVGNDDGAR